MRTGENNLRPNGFTLIELLVVIAILGILASIIIVRLNEARDAAYFSRAKAELKQMAIALELYLNDYQDYPPDVDRDIPPGLEPYLGPGNWPDAPWPGSVYDWDNWGDPDTPGAKIYQISIRFCPLGQPELCRFPDELWAVNFDIYSAAYYCIEGACRSHITQPINHPGYCVNCNP